jgi:hypothetical protein
MKQNAISGSYTLRLPSKTMMRSYVASALPHSRAISSMKLCHMSGATRQIHCRSEYTLCHRRRAYLRHSSAPGLKSRERVPPIKDQSVPVTKNLYSALRHLRLHDKVRVLWIDALCINQSDLAERSHQIPYMGSIFSVIRTARQNK